MLLGLILPVSILFCNMWVLVKVAQELFIYDTVPCQFSTMHVIAYV